MASSNELETILNDIKADKNTNLIPQNLKKGVKALGVNGALEVVPDVPDTEKDYILYSKAGVLTWVESTASTEGLEEQIKNLEQQVKDLKGIIDNLKNLNEEEF